LGLGVGVAAQPEGNLVESVVLAERLQGIDRANDARRVVVVDAHRRSLIEQLCHHVMLPRAAGAGGGDWIDRRRMVAAGAHADRDRRDCDEPGSVATGGPHASQPVVPGPCANKAASPRTLPFTVKRKLYCPGRGSGSGGTSIARSTGRRGSSHRI